MDALVNDPVVAAFAVAIATTVGLLVILTKGKGSAPVALNKDEYTPFPLIEKEELSHDTRRFRFGLQSKAHRLGLPIGQHVSLKFTDDNGKMVLRSYTPTTSDEERGFVDFVIKVYFANVHPKFPDGGKMSQHLEKLRIGDYMLMRGPKGTLTYHGKGKFEMVRKGTMVVRKVGMVAGGTGITPMLQIINAILREGSGISMNLLFANQTEDDILLRDMIEGISTRYPGADFSFEYTLDRPPEGWTGSSGFVSEEMCRKHLPAPADDVLLLMCGPPPMIEYACKPAFAKLGFKEEQYFAF